MASKTQQIALQFAQALESISNGAPFVMEKVELESDSLSNQFKGQQDINSLVKELQEINRLIKAKSNNKKVENGYAISKSIVQLDFQTGQESLFEHLNLLESKEKGDLIAMIIQQKQKDLPDVEKSVNSEFVNQLISKEEIKASFALATAFITASITKSNLIKELRKNPIKEMIKLLEVILILLQNTTIVPVSDDKYIPTFEQICEWVEALLDAYYLNFCLKDSWKDLLEKLDAEIESRNKLYEQSKSFAESISTYQKCYDNIQKSVNKVESQFYVKSLYL